MRTFDTSNAKPDFQPLNRQAEETKEEKALRRVSDAIHRANTEIALALEAGFSVELARKNRLHDGQGNWADQMVPMVRSKATDR